MTRSGRIGSTLAIALIGILAAAATDIDQFMSRVMQNRRIDAERLRDYVFSEKEELDIKGPRIAAIESFRREYVWFVRDGYLVRSPVKINGVKVSKEEQAAAEEEWFEREKKRTHGNSLDREAFFGFKFEPGRYLFAGEQEFEGRKAVVVEYYPVMSGDEDRGRKRDKRDDDLDTLFEKPSLSPCSSTLKNTRSSGSHSTMSGWISFLPGGSSGSTILKRRW